MYYAYYWAHGPLFEIIRIYQHFRVNASFVNLEMLRPQEHVYCYKNIEPHMLIYVVVFVYALNWKYLSFFSKKIVHLSKSINLELC